MPKYIFVTGGVMSGLGKGVTAASVAKLLKLSGLKVTCIKIDPYLNVDAGTMNPIIHGEVFVTDDGGETDMDIGTYERFLDQNLSKHHNITTGQIYKAVIEAERRGDYLGKCVQIIPHVTDEIKKRIKQVVESDGAEIGVVECGGTVGDIESLPFLEAMRQMRLELGPLNSLFLHVTLAPELEAVKEQKTKPTQHSVQELRRIGIQPDIIVVRSKRPLAQQAREKISLFTSVPLEAVISNPDVESIYDVPEVLEKQGITRVIASRLNLKIERSDLSEWIEVAESFKKAKRMVNIAMVGKYVSLADSYVSVNQALLHSGAKLGASVNIDWVDSELIEKSEQALNNLRSYNGILIPGGFGKRGVEGKIKAAGYAIREGIPYLGICLGFQVAAIAIARYLCGLEKANSTEFDPDAEHAVIDLLPEQKGIKEIGATMRLGGHDIMLKEKTLSFKLYGKKIIRERHRHRYEINQRYKPLFEEKNVIFSGYSDEGKRIEILEIANHPFFLATQFHAEFTSRPGAPNPVYLGFIKACIENPHN
ncbi:MAG: CTP synthase [Nitrososphaerales archaeon]